MTVQLYTDFQSSGSMHFLPACYGFGFACLSPGAQSVSLEEEMLRISLVFSLPFQWDICYMCMYCKNLGALDW